MVNHYSAAQLIYNNTARWQPYGVFINSPMIADTPTFTTAQDPLEFIPTGFPYPSGGINLGIINGSVKIKKNANLQDEEPTDLQTTSDERFYSGYKRTVEFQLLSSGRKAVVEIFDDPGFSSDTDSTGGGLSTAPSYILINMFKDAHHEDVFLCYIHWSVTPLPADEEFGGDIPAIINANFRCYAGYSPSDPTCLRSPGTQIWRKIYINSAGTMVDPDDPGAIPTPNANMASYFPFMASW